MPFSNTAERGGDRVGIVSLVPSELFVQTSGVHKINPQTQKRILIAEVNKEEREEQYLSQPPTKRRQAKSKTSQTNRCKLALEAREKVQEEEDGLQEIPYKKDVVEKVRSTDPRQRDVS